MIFNVYAIRDKKVGFMSPTIDQNDASAARNFEHACQQTSSLMFSHPEDYDLFRIGTYDTDNGCLTRIQVPVLIASASDM